MNKPNYKLIGLLILAALFVTINVFAQAPAPTPEPTPPTPWWITLLSCLATVVTAGLAWVGKILIAKMHLNAAQAEAMDACTAAVAQTYQDFVWELKKAGKFDAAAQERAREMAINLAKDLAKGPGKDLLLSYGKEHIGAWIEQIITKLKGGTKLENGIVAAKPTATP